jgi:hypothetical protein
MRLAPGCLLLAGCAASPWVKVKDAKTIEEARTLLGGTTPQVTPYPPNAEAWYFGKNECVLFVDGKLRFSKSSYSVTDETPVRDAKQQQVLCTPSDVKD